MKKLVLASALSFGLLGAPSVQAADYVIDTEGAHAFIQFKVSHLGYSWLLGRFNEFEGSFSYDEANPSAAKVKVTINVASLDSNHAERDKHLRSKDFFDVRKHPKASFESTSYAPNGDGTGVLTGNFTLHGTTKPIEIDVQEIGAGSDPWGGYRRGFEGALVITPAEFGMNYDLGPAAETVEIYLSIEGIRQ
jgi:polyisoprenoid-binding protein YceI